ncbi:MAG: alpha/beta family hydrolase [Planctomycetota bacterium]
MAATTPTRELRMPTPRGDVGALLQLPDDAEWLYVFSHGAGAPMRHAFMTDLSARLADRGIATLRFNFPYADKPGGRGAPDPQPVLVETVRQAVALAAQVAPGLPLAAGGKSMGGRMTSMAHAESPLPGVLALIYVGFPLHPAGGEIKKRADHLPKIESPQLFLTGTRDSLCLLDRLHPVLGTCQQPTLRLIDDADHGFHVRKSSGRDDDAVLDELADTMKAWFADVMASQAGPGKPAAKKQKKAPTSKAARTSKASPAGKKKKTPKSPTSPTKAKKKAKKKSS